MVSIPELLKKRCTKVLHAVQTLWPGMYQFRHCGYGALQQLRHSEQGTLQQLR